jgi:hypothetical protein
MTRSGASAYHPGLAIDDRRWYSQWCQSKGCYASAPPHRRKDRTHVSHRAGGGGQHGRWMWQGCCWWRSCLVRDVVAFNLGQDGARGAARRVRSTRMRRIAALTGSGGSTGAITRSLSEWHCFWRFPPGATYHPPKPAWAMPNLPIPGFAPRPTPTSPMPQCIWPTLGNVARMHHWPMLSPAQSSHGDVTSRQAPVVPTLQLVQLPCDGSARWQESSPQTSLFALLPHGDITPWRVPVLPTPQLVWLPCSGIAHWRVRVLPMPKEAWMPCGGVACRQESSQQTMRPTSKPCGKGAP